MSCASRMYRSTWQADRIAKQARPDGGFYHDPGSREDEAGAQQPAAVTRFKTMLEVCVSKIGPAGAGWWGANIYATECLGLTSTDLGYFCVTGLGDGGAVLVGHCTYFLIKSLVRPAAKIDMSKELQSGSLLGGAAFLSGFVWQPTCNVLEQAPFVCAALGTGAACGSAFFVGLRLLRATFSLVAPATFSAIGAPSAENLKDDAALSVAIAGATGTFVGVVVDFPDNPFLLSGSSIAILATASAASGCLSSAKATCLGFAAVQTAQNCLSPRGENWIDGCNVDGTYKTS